MRRLLQQLVADILICAESYFALSFCFFFLVFNTGISWQHWWRRWIRREGTSTDKDAEDYFILLIVSWFCTTLDVSLALWNWLKLMLIQLGFSRMVLGNKLNRKAITPYCTHFFPPNVRNVLTKHSGWDNVCCCLTPNCNLQNASLLCTLGLGFKQLLEGGNPFVLVTQVGVSVE